MWRFSNLQDQSLDHWFVLSSQSWPRNPCHVRTESLADIKMRPQWQHWAAPRFGGFKLSCQVFSCASNCLAFSEPHVVPIKPRCFPKLNQTSITYRRNEHSVDVHANDYKIIIFFAQCCPWQVSILYFWATKVKISLRVNNPYVW